MEAGNQILIVDDIEIVSSAMQMILTHEGFEVECVPDGHAAIERAREKAYRIIFIDLIMPGLSGIETCRALHTIAPQTTCIMMTGQVEQDPTALQEQFVEAGGFAEALQKPFGKQDILDIVGRVMTTPMASGT